MGWVGTLDTLENCQGYMIRLSEAGTVLQSGEIVDPDSTPVPLATGWNWIGYIPRSTFSVPDALADLGGVLSNGDLIKSGNAFSQYVTIDVPGWYGSLDSLESGNAYNLFVANAGVTSEFHYPMDPAIVGGVPGVCAATVPSMTLLAVNASGWHFNPNTYEHNMVLLTVLDLDGREWRSSDYAIGAFVGEECRGVTEPIYLPRLDRFVAFLTIHSNKASGELITLRAFNGGDEAHYDIDQSFVFVADDVRGTLREPMVASGAISDGPTGVPSRYALRQNFPNPFNPTTTIRFELPIAGDVTLTVFNVAGQEVRTLANRYYEAGVHDIIWDAHDAGGRSVATGIYFYRLETGTFNEVKKMVLLK